MPVVTTWTDGAASDDIQKGIDPGEVETIATPTVEHHGVLRHPALCQGCVVVRIFGTLRYRHDNLRLTHLHTEQQQRKL